MSKKSNRIFSQNKEQYVTTLGRLFEYATDTYGNRPLSGFVDDGIEYTYASFKHKCLDLSHRLNRYGIGARDKVAILSSNMPNWTVAMFACVPFGRVTVPILPDSSQNEVTNILLHSECKAIFISRNQRHKLTDEIMDRLTLVFDIETFELIKKDDKAFTCEGFCREPQADDLASIIYTSGTSGKSKGVMLSHRNFCQNVIAAFHAQKCGKRDRWLSILPMSHTYEMAFSVLYPLFVGGCVYYLRKPPTVSVLMPAMKKLKPTVMCIVPLIIEKVYKHSVVPTVRKSRILSWMDKHCHGLLCWIIGRKIYSLLGGHLRFFGIGGAKLDPVVEEFLYKARFPYAIGYGLTETAPLITNACVGKTAVGSIGVPAHGVEVKLDNVNPQTGEGEIIARGDNVMLGYYRDPERTRQAVTDDGWFHTGDLASMDEKGRYYIKGRLGNMIVGPSGENIYPEEIELVINNFSGVNESLVIEKEGKLVALVKFDDNLLNWNQEKEDKFFENLEAKKKAILEYVNKRVNKQSKLSDVEPMKEDFEKTATAKIRRFKYSEAVSGEKADSSDAAAVTTDNAQAAGKDTHGQQEPAGSEKAGSQAKNEGAADGKEPPGAE